MLIDIYTFCSVFDFFLCIPSAFFLEIEKCIKAKVVKSKARYFAKSKRQTKISLVYLKKVLERFHSNYRNIFQVLFPQTYHLSCRIFPLCLQKHTGLTTV